MAKTSGPIAWMVNNRVTPNLLMIFLIVGGLFMSTKIKKEVFPAFELDRVTVSIAYPGSSPEEVEKGVVLAVEDAISSVDGIKEVFSTAAEGAGVINAELLEDATPQMVLQDIQQAVDRITTFPVDAEDPTVSLASHPRQVLRLNIYGDVEEGALREIAERVKDRLLQDNEITQITISGARDFEVHVEIPLEKLRMHGLTLAGVAEIIRQSSVEIPGGKVDTKGGEVLLRVDNRREWANEFARIPIVTSAGGTTVYLEDLAEVSEGFENSNREAAYEGQRSLSLRIYRVGKQTPIGISEATRKVIADIEPDMPPGIQLKITSDRSEIYKQRLHLLLKNAFIGLALVLILLGIFLDLRLAFWVTMGIPTSFLGGLLFLPMFDISINMISMFAFIISLGIVVDDAIISGENIYEYRQRGLNFIQAAIAGAKDVALPVSFSIITNIVAFMPLLFVPGTMGKIWKVIPLVTITVFIISWVESLFILPAHLGHSKKSGRKPLFPFISRFQQAVVARFNWFVANVYGRAIEHILRATFLTVALLIAVLLITFGYVKSGRIGMIFMPRVESDRAVVTATLPFGSPTYQVEQVRDQIVDAMDRVKQANGGDQLVEGVLSLIDENKIEVYAYLTPPDIRPMSTRQVTRMWRREVGTIVGLQSSIFESDRGGPGSGAAISVELAHRDINILDQASAALAEKLTTFPATKDIDDGYTPGKSQFSFTINERGRSLGLTPTEVGRQVRHSFQGAIALRQQRGPNEVTVRVRLPEEQRLSEFNVERLLIATPAKTFVPLSEIAEMKRGRAYTSITRRDGRRTVLVKANVEPIDMVPQIFDALNSRILPELASEFPGLSYGYKGRQANRMDSVKGLFQGFLFALVSIYFLLAIPFRSYSQPIIVMLAIPFGMVGAVLGHLIMGYNISLMSMMGVVALSGIVVNDSLVLVDYANKQRRDGATPHNAIRSATLRRFRPVILTTLTTFCGLAPMIFETSRQARFMIPMALSLGFGILFATIITLVLVPCLFLIVENVRVFLRSAAGSSHAAELTYHEERDGGNIEKSR